MAKTIYKKSGDQVISRNVPSFDVGYYEQRGWSTSEPQTFSPEQNQRDTNQPQQQQNQVPPNFEKIDSARYSSLYENVRPGSRGVALYGKPTNDIDIKKQMVDSGVDIPSNREIQTNLRDVYNNFSRIKGREPRNAEDFENLSYLATKSPREVEQLLGRDKKEEPDRQQNQGQQDRQQNQGQRQQNQRQQNQGQQGLTNKEIKDIYQEAGFPIPTREDIENNIRGELPTDSRQKLENVLFEQRKIMEGDTGMKLEGKKDRRWISPQEFRNLQATIQPQEIQQMTESEKNQDGTKTYYWKKDVYDNMPFDEKPSGTTLTPGMIAEQFKDYGYSLNRSQLSKWMNKDQNQLTTLQDTLESRSEKQKEEEKKQVASKDSTPKKGIFEGGEALIKIADNDGNIGSTVWLADKDSKTMRPILSRGAFEARYGMTPQEASEQGKIKILPTSYAEGGAPLEGFSMLPENFGVDESGEYKKTPGEIEIDNNEGQDQDSATEEAEYDPTKIMNTYGETSNERLNRQMFKVVDRGIFDFYKNLGEKNNGGISEKTLKEVSNDPEIIATYTNALAYGGYNLNDIYRDLKRRELIRQGKEEYKDVKVIDETSKRIDFYNNETQKAIETNPELQPPDTLGGIDTDLLDNPVFDIPNDVYKTLVQPVDWNSAEGKEALDEIKSSYHDVLLQQLEAGTEQEKARADQVWEETKRSIEDEYGIELSQNVTKAWNQIENLNKQIQNRGLAGSGIASEMKQNYLADLRRGQEMIRGSEEEEREIERKEYLQEYGSPEEIAALSEQEKEKYGFKPSAETREFFSKQSLKERYPDLSDRQIEEYRSSILDEQGNYRGKIYQNLWRNKKKQREDKRTYQLGDVQYDEDTGKVIGGHGLLYQEALESEKAYKPYEKSGPFEKPSETEFSGAREAVEDNEQSGSMPNSETKQSGSPNDEEFAIEMPDNYQTTKEDRFMSLPEEEQQSAIGEFGKRHGKMPEPSDWSKVHDIGLGEDNQKKKQDKVREKVQEQKQPQQTKDYGFGEDYEKIPNPQKISEYKDIKQPEGTIDMYGKKRKKEDNPVSSWQKFKKQNSNRDWSGYEKISSPSKMNRYSDVQNPGGRALYGKRK